MSAGEEISVRLPDGSLRSVDASSSGYDLALGISKGLARAVVMVVADGIVRDLTRPLSDFLTAPDTPISVELLKRDDPRVLEVLRHDAAHVLAQAAQELYEGLQITFGPSTETGFYYDFATREPLTPDDLEKIEARMHEIVKRDLKITREVWERGEAEKHFLALGETFKAEFISEISSDEPLTIYRQGDWQDMCRGPHLPSTGVVGHSFRLTHMSGAYWRGDPANPQLQRVYGVCFASDAELEEHLRLRAEAEARDHRRLGPALGLFHLQDDAPGAVFWHPRGCTIWRCVEEYIRRRVSDGGYEEVKTPQLIDRSLWETSGHWDKYRENMFIAESENRTLAVKPMNCPGHVQIYRKRLVSYRELPIRMAEFGACHRNEPSGALHGMMRLRAFTQDDAHIFCREDQIASETSRFCTLLRSIYSDFGFDDVSIKFATRPEVRAGSDTVWDSAEAALRSATEAAGVPFSEDPGEGAFYGPKLDFFLRDALNRVWQCGTFQCDFVLPERLGATYIAEDGARHRPVMLHRAIVGSLERFIAILLESCGGALPLWLAPVQVVAATITERSDAYAAQVEAACRKAGLRVATDLRNEKISYKVREHSLQKVPYIFTLGDREAESGEVSLRAFGSRTSKSVSLEDAISALSREARPPDVGRLMESDSLA